MAGVDDLEVRDFLPATATDAQWAAFHRYRRARHQESGRNDPLWPDEAFRSMVSRPVPHWTPIWRAVSDGPDIVSVLETAIMDPDAPAYETNKHLLDADFAVLEPYRRRGIATHWLRDLAVLMTAHDKRVLGLRVEEADGHAFARRCGADVKFVVAENHLDLGEVDWAMVRSWVADGEAASPTTTLTIHQPRLPPEVVSDYCGVVTRLLNTMPFDDLDHGEIVLSPEGIEEMYGRNAAIGAIHHVTMVRERDGSISGVTDTSWSCQMPTVVRQRFTGVDPAQRGRGLGKWIKAAMLEYIRATYPQAQVVITGNAESNAPMRSINERLGFREYRLMSSYQISRATLCSFLAV
ncbi:MAG: hypothetical protein NVS3B12_23570 [Acidimicrobiales bacterium]